MYMLLGTDRQSDIFLAQCLVTISPFGLKGKFLMFFMVVMFCGSFGAEEGGWRDSSF